MRRITPWLGLGMVITSALAAPAIDLPYVGDRHDPERVDEARTRVLAELPAAIAQAEQQFGRPLDRHRVTYRLQDIPVRRRAKTTTRMLVRAGDPLQLVVFVEPVLRGAYPAPAALRAALDREVIEVLARQHSDPADYRRLPAWFREGMSVHLSGQLRERVLNRLPAACADPQELLAGLDGDPNRNAALTGGYFCAAVEARVGREAFLRFVYGALETGSVDHGLVAIDLMHAEMSVGESEAAWNALWAEAATRAQADLRVWTGEAGGDFAESMRRYEAGDDAGAIAGFEALIEAYPGSWAAEVASYWAAKSHYRRGETAAALAGFSSFGKASRRYGLLEDARYYHIRLLERAGSVPELREACAGYLALFPDGADNAKVREILAGLPAAAGR